VGGICIVSPFTSIGEVVRSGAGYVSKRVGRFGASIINERLNSLEAIKSVTCPTVIFHGKEDQLVPVRMGEELKDASGAEKIVLKTFDKMDHDDVFEECYIYDEIGMLLNAWPLNQCGEERIVMVEHGGHYQTISEGVHPLSISEEQDATNTMAMIFEGLSALAESACEADHDGEMQARLAETMLSNLRILFRTADLNHDETLQAVEIELMLRTYHQNQGLSPDDLDKSYSDQAAEVLETYDITSTNDLGFYEFIEMFCHGTCMCMPMPEYLKRDVRLLAAEEFMQAEAEKEAEKKKQDNSNKGAKEDPPPAPGFVAFMEVITSAGDEVRDSNEPTEAHKDEAEDEFSDFKSPAEAWARDGSSPHSAAVEHKEEAASPVADILKGTFDGAEAGRQCDFERVSSCLHEGLQAEEARQAATSSMLVPLKEGDAVVIVGHESIDLNGQMALVRDYDSWDEEFEVELEEEEGARYLLKRPNLRRRVDLISSQDEATEHRVVITGNRNPQLNGQLGIIQAFDEEKNRYELNLDTGLKILARPEHLTAIEAGRPLIQPS